VQLLAPSPAPSCVSSITPSPVSSGGPSPAPSSILSGCDPLPGPEGLSQSESSSDSNDDAAGSGHELGLFGPEGAGGKEDEDEEDNAEDEIDIFMDAGGSKLKEDIRNWHELRDRIISDLAMAHK
jgi:hypothetical protein